MSHLDTIFDFFTLFRNATFLASGMLLSLLSYCAVEVPRFS